MQELGLQTAYRKDHGLRAYLRQILALPLMPQEHISVLLQQLTAEATTEQQLQLCDYVHQTWITSAIWPPNTW